MSTAASVFSRFVPDGAIPYCVRLYEELNFDFRIKKARRTKFGDYRFDPLGNKHSITINNDLNTYAFLITYLHEVAHLVTYNTHKRSVKPHGNEWKENFIKVATPVLNSDVFPPKVLTSLQAYLTNPKASSCSDPHLYQILKAYDHPSEQLLLKDLEPGTSFLFNKKSFEYLEMKRTRVICKDLTSGRKYLINQLAEVKEIT
ncbi:MAG: SprT protein [Cyclobacteriaceae bacterium]|jgi:SprT protein